MTSKWRNRIVKGFAIIALVLLLSSSLMGVIFQLGLF